MSSVRRHRATARLLSARARVLARSGGDTAMVGLAIAVGLLTGALAVALIAAIRWVQSVAFGTTSDIALLVAPFVGGLLVGLLALRVPSVAGGGVTPVMTAVALHGGRMPSAVAPAKLAASAVSLGTGASGGREGPIVQIGGAVASLLGRALSLDDERMRTLIAAGAGAGIAASFNAPLTGIFFAIEIIIGGYRVPSLQTVVVTCVVASVTARQLVGSAITYRLLDPPQFGEASELLIYALLGLAAAVVGVAFSRGEHLVARLAARSSIWPPLRTALGALSVGVIALALPEVLGSGEHLPATLGGMTEPVEGLLQGQLGTGYAAAGYAAALLVGKLVATCLAVGTGSSVGSFAPALFLGAALGAVFHHLGEGVLGGAPPVDVGALALVGAAAVLAAAAHAPLTAILLAFELTNDYAMVLPLMLTTGIAMLVSERLDRDSIYTRALRERGIVYAEPNDVDVLQSVTVGEVMTTSPPSVPADLPLPDLIDRFGSTGHHGFVVIAADSVEPRLVGVVTLSDLGRPDAEGLDREPTAGDLATTSCVTVTPRDPVFRALRRMAAINVGRLPVVAADDHARVVGLFRRSDLVTAYQRAMTRSLAAQQRKATTRLRDLVGVTFIELKVDPRSSAVGQLIREVAWPGRTVVTSIRRRGEVVMPSGNTALEPDDELVILADPAATEAIRNLVGPTIDTSTP